MLRRRHRRRRCPMQEVAAMLKARRKIEHGWERQSKKIKRLRLYITEHTRHMCVSRATPLNLPKLFGPISSEFL